MWPASTRIAENLNEPPRSNSNVHCPFKHLHDVETASASSSATSLMHRRSPNRPSLKSFRKLVTLTENLGEMTNERTIKSFVRLEMYRRCVKHRINHIQMLQIEPESTEKAQQPNQRRHCQKESRRKHRPRRPSSLEARRIINMKRWQLNQMTINDSLRPFLIN